MAYVVLVTGLSTNPLACTLQIAGIFASLISVAKTTGEFHVYTSFNLKNTDGLGQIPPNIFLTLRIMLFFAPHVFFRTIAMTLIAVYLKWYSLIPLTVYLLINLIITFVVDKKYRGQQEDTDDASQNMLTIQNYFLSLFAPSVVATFTKLSRETLKYTMLSSTIILLPCLIFIRLLPLFNPETTSCTLGLYHLNLLLPVPECSACFNITTNVTGISQVQKPKGNEISLGTPCVMVTTLDDFSAYIFVPFLILGVWCLFEGDKFPLIEFFCPRDSNHMQEEKLAPSLLADRGSVDHGQGFNTHTTLHFR